jgi:hypothetical protein
VARPLHADDLTKRNYEEQDTYLENDAIAIDKSLSNIESAVQLYKDAIKKVEGMGMDPLFDEISKTHDSIHD